MRSTAIHFILVLLLLAFLIGVVHGGQGKYIRQDSQIRFWILTDMHYDDNYVVCKQQMQQLINYNF